MLQRLQRGLVHGFGLRISSASSELAGLELPLHHQSPKQGSEEFRALFQYTVGTMMSVTHTKHIISTWAELCLPKFIC